MHKEKLESEILLQNICDFKSLHNKVAIGLNIGENQVEQRDTKQTFTLTKYGQCLNKIR